METIKFDNAPIVVIGGGLAGLSAALEALHNGYPVYLFEKNVLSGNSAKATSGINAVNTEFQLQQIKSGEINDSVSLFSEDIMSAGHNANDPNLVRVLAARSGAALDTLIKRYGLVLSDIRQLGGHRTRRTHRFPPKDGRVQPVGWTIVSTLKRKLFDYVEKGAAVVVEHAAVTDILFDSALGPNGQSYSYVKAVTVRDLRKETLTQYVGFRSIVIAAGGYAADSSPTSVLAQHRPDLIGLPTTNDPIAAGDMIRVAERNHLRLLGLKEVQLHPTSFVDPNDPNAKKKFLCPEVMRGVGAILLTPPGNRFVDELLPRDKVSQAIRELGATAAEWGLGIQKGKDDDDLHDDTDSMTTTTDVQEDDSPKGPSQKIAMMLMTEEIANKFGMEAFKFYALKGFIKKIQTPDDLPLAIDWNTLLKTCHEHDQAAQGRQQDQFGKTTFPSEIGDLSKVPYFYIAYITPALHYTMGGIHIDGSSRALTESGAPVMNLFVSGEAAGGVHGRNRLGGNGCLESIVFGQLSGFLAPQITVDAKIQQTAFIKGDEYLVTEVREDSCVVLLQHLNDVLDDAQSTKGRQFSIRSSSKEPKGTISVTSALQTGPGSVLLKFDSVVDLLPGDYLIPA